MLLSKRLDCVKVFIDDTAIIGQNLSSEEHLKELDKILAWIEDTELKLNIRKNKWAVSEVKYLGFIASKNRHKLDLKKVEALLNAKVPKN